MEQSGRMLQDVAYRLIIDARDFYWRLSDRRIPARLADILLPGLSAFSRHKGFKRSCAMMSR
jgi:hypothetical protein